jgi:hypothetical protein
MAMGTGRAGGGENGMNWMGKREAREGARGGNAVGLQVERQSRTYEGWPQQTLHGDLERLPMRWRPLQVRTSVGKSGDTSDASGARAHSKTVGGCTDGGPAARSDPRTAAAACAGGGGDGVMGVPMLLELLGTADDDAAAGAGAGAGWQPWQTGKQRSREAGRRRRSGGHCCWAFLARWSRGRSWTRVGADGREWACRTASLEGWALHAAAGPALISPP